MLLPLQFFNKHHSIQLPELFIEIYKHVLFDIFDIKISAFFSSLLSIENDRSTAAEIG